MPMKTNKLPNTEIARRLLETASWQDFQTLETTKSLTIDNDYADQIHEGVLYDCILAGDPPTEYEKSECVIGKVKDLEERYNKVRDFLNERNLIEKFYEEYRCLDIIDCLSYLQTHNDTDGIPFAEKLRVLE